MGGGGLDKVRGIRPGRYVCWLELGCMFTDAYVNYDLIQCQLNVISINI